LPSEDHDICNPPKFHVTLDGSMVSHMRIIDSIRLLLLLMLAIDGQFDPDYRNLTDIDVNKFN